MSVAGSKSAVSSMVTSVRWRIFHRVSRRTAPASTAGANTESWAAVLAVTTPASSKMGAVATRV
eukprot:4185031-Pyramimonas_sp.AAC.2